MQDFIKIPFPPIRKATVDLLSVAIHKHMIHALVELDITHVRNRLRQIRRNGETVPSLTSYMIYCCAQVVAEIPMLQAYRSLSNHLVLFSDVDISLPIEKRVGDSMEVIPSIIRGANNKAVIEIDEEIINNRNSPLHTSKMRLYLLIPSWLRRLFFRIAGRMPKLVKRQFGTVMITSVGMFGRGAGWAIPICTHTLNMAIGGIVKRTELYHGEAVEHEFLFVTVSFDHDIVDGAPAARFIHRFKRMVEQAKGLQ